MVLIIMRITGMTGKNTSYTQIIIIIIITRLFLNLKHLMHGHICDPNVALVIDGDAVRHVEETCSPAGQYITGFRAQGDNGVRQNGTLLYVLVMVRLVE